MTWATNLDAARHWPDSTTLDQVRLAELLDAATAQCAAYAPALDATAPVPATYTLAVVYQAREVYAATTRDGDLIGAGDLAFRSKPLTATVKQLLRPESRGGVG